MEVQEIGVREILYQDELMSEKAHIAKKGTRNCPEKRKKQGRRAVREKTKKVRALRKTDA